MFEPCFVLAEVHAAIAHDLFAEAFSKWILKVTFEDGPLWLNFHSKPIFFASFETALVLRTVFKQIEPKSVDLASIEITLVHLPIRQFNNAPAVRQVVLEIADVLHAVHIELPKWKTFPIVSHKSRE